jgi:7,8-dihydropterin-6-yl-methyl-4-(beta-D-ribofuranosyl)aminobenzene 5'-phosphate synthase
LGIFRALVEIKNRPKILFDTGANGKILLFNMEKLGIDPLKIEKIFISHLHFDHTDRLNDFLKINPNKEIELRFNHREEGLFDEMVKLLLTSKNQLNPLLV